MQKKNVVSFKIWLKKKFMISKGYFKLFCKAQGKNSRHATIEKA